MKKQLILLLIFTMISGTTFAQTRMLMNNDGIGINPATPTETTRAKLWVNGAGPVQNVPSYYLSLNEKMGIKAATIPTTGVNTSAIVGITDYKLGTTPFQTGQSSGVIGFAASLTNAYGIQGIADAATSGSVSYGVKGYASNSSDNTFSYGGTFSSFREGSSNSTGYGIYASTYHNYGSGGGNSYGGYFNVDGTGIGQKFGAFSKVNQIDAGTPGISAIGFNSEISGKYSSQVIGFRTSIASGGINGTYGGIFDVLGTGTGNQTGLLVNVKSTNATGAGTIPSERIGIYSDVEGSVYNFIEFTI